MKVALSTEIDLPPETVWAEVQTAELLTQIAWPLVRFLAVGDAPLKAFKHDGRYQVRLRLFGIIPFGTQWIVISVYTPESGEWPKRLRDNGYSALISKWDHWIIITPDGKGGSHYSDEVEISAGLLTPFVWAFAQVFYRHRQRRLRSIASTLQARRLIAEEMATFQNARISGDVASAWRALERLHILSQTKTWPHIRSHLQMLGYAAAIGDGKEIIGQLARLALAPIGNITGRLPIGNTGRANVSAFVPMDIPADLRSVFESETP